LVEHDLAKVGVAGPSPVSRSKIKRVSFRMLFFYALLRRPACFLKEIAAF